MVIVLLQEIQIHPQKGGNTKNKRKRKHKKWMEDTVIVFKGASVYISRLKTFQSFVAYEYLTSFFKLFGWNSCQFWLQCAAVCLH
jgi:hypothetical protein